MADAPYDHRYHAGNHADVWKHVAWLAVLAAHKRDRLLVVDTHAGRGSYALPARGGEWTSGVGKLRARFAGTQSGSGAVDRYLARLPAPPAYLGSPLLTRQALGRADQLVAYEQDPEAAAALREALSSDPRARVVAGDGWEADLDGGEAKTVVLCDPPFHEQRDWIRIAELADRAFRAGAAALCWYPIKRWTRPVNLHNGLRERRVPHVALDVLFTPIEHTGHSLAGSGVVLVGMPGSVVAELQAAVPVLGEVLATHDGRWSSRAEAHAPR